MFLLDIPRKYLKVVCVYVLIAYDSMLGWCISGASVWSKVGVVSPSPPMVYCSIKNSLCSNGWVKAQFQTELWFPVFHFLVFNSSWFLFHCCFSFALNFPLIVGHTCLWLSISMCLIKPQLAKYLLLPFCVMANFQMYLCCISISCFPGVQTPGLFSTKETNFSCTWYNSSIRWHTAWDKIKTCSHLFFETCWENK